MRKLIGELEIDFNSQITSLEDSLDFGMNVTILSEMVETIQGSQEKLEGDFVQFQFDVEDEISSVVLELNETIVGIREMLEIGFEEQLDSTKQFLTSEINNKLHIMNDNMKKFSDVSALGANELRNLFESEILELQVKVGDIEERRKIFEASAKNSQLENGRKFTDIIEREEAYQKMFLELSNEFELGKSSLSEFKLKTSQKISSISEKSQGNDLALKDVLDSISTLKFSEDNLRKELEDQESAINMLEESAKENVEKFRGLSVRVTKNIGILENVIYKPRAKSTKDALKARMGDNKSIHLLCHLYVTLFKRNILVISRIS